MFPLYFLHSFQQDDSPVEPNIAFGLQQLLPTDLPGQVRKH